MTELWKFIACALFLWMAECGAMADVRMPAIFGNHMVLQRGMGVPVWGTAEPGEMVTVTVGDHSAKVKAGADGTWKVRLEPFAENVEPVTMTVTGKNTVRFTDVLIGEVWVCSGQSNMAYPLAKSVGGQEAISKARDAQLRLFTEGRRMSHRPVTELEGKWEVCAPDVAASFSAVGYFFGEEIRGKLGRPAGLIAMHYGGSSAVAWTSMEGLAKEPALHSYVKRWRKIDAAYASGAANYAVALQTYKTAMDTWNAEYGKQFSAAMAQWQQETLNAIKTKQPLPSPPKAAVATPRKPDNPEGDEFDPATLYNGMVAPLEPFAMRGVIWYQGETNAPKAGEYRTLFSRLIQDWREHWGEGDFPFLYVQLAGYRAGNTDDWAQLREAQLQTLPMANTGMASAVDIGEPDKIHPMDKLDVGKRLALAALHVAYGMNNVYRGPIVSQITKEGGRVRIRFTDTGSGLVIGQAPWVGALGDKLPTDHLVGFEVGTHDGQWKAADAVIDGDTVVVSSAGVPDPAAVRYGWSDYPEGNLYNKEGLPASPFRGSVNQTDDLAGKVLKSK